MTDVDIAWTLEEVEGTWAKLTPEKLRAWKAWLTRSNLTRQNVRDALDWMIDQGRRYCTIPEFREALKAVGAIHREMGVGDPLVVSAMKERIMAFAIPAAERDGCTVPERLRRELSETNDWHNEAVRNEDEEAQKYYRDRLAAYQQLLDEA